MTAFSTDASTFVVQMVAGISCTPNALLHPSLGGIRISTTLQAWHASSERHSVELRLEYGTVSWDPETRGPIHKGVPLLTLLCPRAHWDDHLDGHPDRQLDFVQGVVLNIGSPKALAFQQSVLRLGMVRLWSLLAQSQGSRIRTAHIDAVGRLCTYMGHGRHTSDTDIASGCPVPRDDITNKNLLPSCLWATDHPLCAEVFQELDILEHDEHGTQSFPCGMAPVGITQHARMEMLDQILAGYRGMGQPDPDFTNL